MSTTGRCDATVVREPAHSSTMSPRQTSSHRHMPLPRQEELTASSTTTDDPQEDASRTALTTSVKRSHCCRTPVRSQFPHQYCHESHNSDDTYELNQNPHVRSPSHHRACTRQSDPGGPSSHHRTSEIVRPPPQAGTRSVLLQVVHNSMSQQYMNTKKPSGNDLDLAHPLHEI